MSSFKSECSTKNQSFEKIIDPLLVEVWKNKNKDHLWESFLEVLKTVRFMNGPWSNIVSKQGGYDRYDDTE